MKKPDAEKLYDKLTELIIDIGENPPVEENIYMHIQGSNWNVLNPVLNISSQVISDSQFKKWKELFYRCLKLNQIDYSKDCRDFTKDFFTYTWENEKMIFGLELGKRMFDYAAFAAYIPNYLDFDPSGKKQFIFKR